MNIKVGVIEGGAQVWYGPLEEFFAANEFEPAEKVEIETALVLTGGYVGGGGASAEFVLVKVKK